MPESFPNQWTVDDTGQVSNSFVLKAGTPTADSVINWGVASPFFNASVESDAVVVPHGLGVVPQLVLISSANIVTHNYLPFLYFAVGFDANVFGFFVRDMEGGAAGPGFWGGYWTWVAIG